MRTIPTDRGVLMAKILRTNSSDEWLARQRQFTEAGIAAFNNYSNELVAEAAAEQKRNERRERFQSRLAVIIVIIAVLSLSLGVVNFILSP
jgi:hypothetical protein